MLALKRHVEDTSDLNINEWKELQEMIKQTKTILLKIFDTKSLNIDLMLAQNLAHRLDIFTGK